MQIPKMGLLLDKRISKSLYLEVWLKVIIETIRQVSASGLGWILMT